MKKIAPKNPSLLLTFSLVVIMASLSFPSINVDLLSQFKKSAIPLLTYHPTPIPDENKLGIPMEESALPTGATNCDQVLIKTRDGENQKIETTRLVLIERGDYKYSVTFVVEDSNVGAIFYSENGVAFRKKDEVIFMDDTRHQQAYRFIGKEKKSGTAIRHNWLKMDQAAITWMAAHPITTIYFKDNWENRMLKFSINPSTQAKLQSLLICLDQESD